MADARHTGAMTHVDLALFGCGNMGLAIVRGAIERGVLGADGVVGIDPTEEARSRAEALGIRTSADAMHAHDAERVLLAVKPQSFDGLSRMLAPLPESCEFISVMSGWTRTRIGAALHRRHGTRSVHRAMPNLPATIGRGVTAIARDAAQAPSSTASGSTAMSFTESLFRAVGDVVFVDESLLDAVTGVSGSGPAYAFLLAESMLEAARTLGFDDETARKLVVGTLDGAVAMLQQDARGPADLRAAVTSRGGTTEAATKVWMDRDIPAGIVEAMRAAAARAEELGRGGPR